MLDFSKKCLLKPDPFLKIDCKLTVRSASIQSTTNEQKEQKKHFSLIRFIRLCHNTEEFLFLFFCYFRFIATSRYRQKIIDFTQLSWEYWISYQIYLYNDS